MTSLIVLMGSKCLAESLWQNQRKVRVMVGAGAGVLSGGGEYDSHHEPTVWKARLVVDLPRCEWNSIGTAIKVEHDQLREGFDSA